MIKAATQPRAAAVHISQALTPAFAKHPSEAPHNPVYGNIKNTLVCGVQGDTGVLPQSGCGAVDVARRREISIRRAETGIDWNFRGTWVRDVERARACGIERDLAGRTKAGVASGDGCHRGCIAAGGSSIAIHRYASGRHGVIAHN